MRIILFFLERHLLVLSTLFDRYPLMLTEKILNFHFIFFLSFFLSLLSSSLSTSFSMLSLFQSSQTQILRSACALAILFSGTSDFSALAFLRKNVFIFITRRREAANSRSSTFFFFFFILSGVEARRDRIAHQIAVELLGTGG